MTGRSVLTSGLIGLVCLAGGSSLRAQPGDAPPPPPPPGPGSAEPGAAPVRQGGPGREEARQRLRRAMAERLAQMKSDQADVERMIGLMDEGKTIEQIREAMGAGTSPRLMEMLRGRSRESGPRGGGMERGGGEGEAGPGPMGGADADLLGEVPGVNPAARPDGGERGPGGPEPRGPDGRGPDGRGPKPNDGQADGPPAGGPGRRGQRPGRDDGPIVLSDEDRQAIREFVGATSPGMARAFAELEKRDPEAAEKRLREVAPRFRELLDLRKRDQRLYELRMIDVREGREALESAREIVKLEAEGVDASDGKHSAATARLRGAIAKQIEARGEAVAHELKKMQERIADGQADLADRGKKKDRLIDEAAARILQRERGRKPGAGGQRPPPPPRGDDDQPAGR